MRRTWKTNTNSAAKVTISNRKQVGSRPNDKNILQRAKQKWATCALQQEIETGCNVFKDAQTDAVYSTSY